MRLTRVITHHPSLGAFCHGSFDHLSGNLFFLLTFGKAVESEERAAGVWLAYLACGVGSALASWLLLPAVSRGVPVVSLGASGAVFGTCRAVAASASCLLSCLAPSQVCLSSRC